MSLSRIGHRKHRIFKTSLGKFVVREHCSAVETEDFPLSKKLWSRQNNFIMLVCEECIVTQKGLMLKVQICCHRLMQCICSTVQEALIRLGHGSHRRLDRLMGRARVEAVSAELLNMSQKKRGAEDSDFYTTTFTAQVSNGVHCCSLTTFLSLDFLRCRAPPCTASDISFLEENSICEMTCIFRYAA